MVVLVIPAGALLSAIQDNVLPESNKTRSGLEYTRKRQKEYGSNVGLETVEVSLGTVIAA